MSRKSNYDSHNYPQKVKPYIDKLIAIDFELAYLSLLTYEGLKPLSRWEKSLDQYGIELLQQAGLSVKQIQRMVKTGNHVVETIFSKSPNLIKIYEQYFADKPIDKSPETQRFEGYLFGYPPCCIEQYVLQPYCPNNLKEHEQKMLFHWACKDCKITPILLPNYKYLYNYLINK